MMDYFIMINSQSGERILPLIDENEEVALFENEEVASNAASDNSMANAYGYEVFKRGE